MTKLQALTEQTFQNGLTTTLILSGEIDNLDNIERVGNGFRSNINGSIRVDARLKIPSDGAGDGFIQIQVGINNDGALTQVLDLKRKGAEFLAGSGIVDLRAGDVFTIDILQAQNPVASVTFLATEQANTIVLQRA